MTRIIRTILFTAGLAGAFSGCATQYPVNFKVHTEPEGAHVVLRQGNEHWTYLGVTPLSAIEIIDEEMLEGKDKISLKTMRCGYIDQVKEWNNEQFKGEIDDKGNIFWTPRLIRNIE